MSSDDNVFFYWKQLKQVVRRIKGLWFHLNFPQQTIRFSDITSLPASDSVSFQHVLFFIIKCQSTSIKSPKELPWMSNMKTMSCSFGSISVTLSLCSHTCTLQRFLISWSICSPPRDLPWHHSPVVSTRFLKWFSCDTNCRKVQG